MLERRFAEDIYSAGVWPRVVAAVVAAFQSKSGGVVDGRKSEENERPPKEGSKGPRGSQARRHRDPRSLALTFNEAVLHTRLIYSPVQRSIVPFEPAESPRWLFKDSSVTLYAFVHVSTRLARET